jgi:hypothetical protein
LTARKLIQYLDYMKAVRLNSRSLAELKPIFPVRTPRSQYPQLIHMRAVVVQHLIMLG